MTHQDAAPTSFVMTRNIALLRTTQDFGLPLAESSHFDDPSPNSALCKILEEVEVDAPQFYHNCSPTPADFPLRGTNSRPREWGHPVHVGCRPLRLLLLAAGGLASLRFELGFNFASRARPFSDFSAWCSLAMVELKHL